MYKPPPVATSTQRHLVCRQFRLWSRERPSAFDNVFLVSYTRTQPSFHRRWWFEFVAFHWFIHSVYQIFFILNNVAPKHRALFESTNMWVMSSALATSWKISYETCSVTSRIGIGILSDWNGLHLWQQSFRKGIEQNTLQDLGIHLQYLHFKIYQFLFVGSFFQVRNID